MNMYAPSLRASVKGLRPRALLYDLLLRYACRGDQFCIPLPPSTSTACARVSLRGSRTSARIVTAITPAKPAYAHVVNVYCSRTVGHEAMVRSSRLLAPKTEYGQHPWGLFTDGGTIGNDG